jgi:GNAT superfamily N-acetyltransferase
MDLEVTDDLLLESYLKRDPMLHIYELGDLDPFFRPHTRWFGNRAHSGPLETLSMLYTGMETPTLLALDRGLPESLQELLVELIPHLPDRFYAHLAVGAGARFENRYRCEPLGLHLKMGLQDCTRLPTLDTAGVDHLTRDNLNEILAFYRESYPGNWFDPRMLETGQYFGVHQDGKLASVAGVHVYAPSQRVAALGNIATDPAHRDCGLGSRTVARLCGNLLESVDAIGLNVKADNLKAIRLYEQLGFEVVVQYEEWLFQR